MKFLRAVLLVAAVAVQIEVSHGGLIEAEFSVESEDVEAGAAVTFNIRAWFKAGNSATLRDGQVDITFVGLSGLSYDSAQASTYLQCGNTNVQTQTFGSTVFFSVAITDFDRGEELDCSITMRLSSSLSPGSEFTQNINLKWTEEEDSQDTLDQLDWSNTLQIPLLQMHLELSSDVGVLDEFYTCGPPYLGIDVVLDFPKSDLTELEVELRWPLGSTDPDVQIIEVPAEDIGDVLEASGVTSGPITANQAVGDLTAGIFSVTDIVASGQSSDSSRDITLQTRLVIVNEFLPLDFNSVITIDATLTHSAQSDDTVSTLTYTASLSFTIQGPEVEQTWECDQYVNGGEIAYCYVNIANTANATTPAKNVELFFDATGSSQVTLQENDIEFTGEFDIYGAEPDTENPDVFVGNVDTGLTLIETLNIHKQIKVKIPFRIDTADVGPLLATKMTIKYDNDYSANPCTKSIGGGETQIEFVMMVPTFPMETPAELHEYFPTNMVLGEEINVTFPMQIPHGNIEMTIVLTTEAHGSNETTYDRHTRDVSEMYTALEILNVEVDSPYEFTMEPRPDTDAGYGFSFPEFTNSESDTDAASDLVDITVSFRMNDLDFLDSGDAINVTWAFVVNGYSYEKIFKMIVGEPEIGFIFKTYEDGGLIYWDVSAIQVHQGDSRSIAYNVTYKVVFNDDIPVVSDSYSRSSFDAEKIFGDSGVDQYWWYRDVHDVEDSFAFSFRTYLDHSNEVSVVAEYRALPPSYNVSRNYTTTYNYPVQLHQTYNARNLRLGLAASACFFIGVLFAMLVMLVCCKRTTILPLPTKFELYSRRPAVRIESWIRDRGDLLLAAELSDDLVQSLTEKDYKSSLTSLDRLDIAHTLIVEEELTKQQRALVLESVGWIVTVSDLKEEGKKLFRQLDKDYKSSEGELIEEEKSREKELETELQASAKLAQEKLMDQQDTELDNLVTVLQGVPFQERLDFIELMKQQHEVQRNDFEVLLKMELEEAREKLRRDYMIRKRVALNILVRDFFGALSEEANLNNDVRDDLISRSKHYIEVIDEAFHEEACRQKFVLEERLLRREATLRVKEERVKYHNNLMNSISSSMCQTINRLIRESLIKRSYGEDLLSQINVTSNENKDTMVEVMKTYEDSVRDTVKNKAQERARKQLNSHLEAYEMFQQRYNDKLNNKEISPAEFLERKIRFHIGRRMEEEELYNEMDVLTGQELAMVWDHFTSESLARFRDNQDRIFETLIKRAIIGSSQTEVQRQRNFRDQTKLETEKNVAISTIENALRQRIADSEERIKCQVEAEKLEQTALKEQEAKMVERLLESQLVMNQETRDNVMREHKRNLLELEEGLTVQKLRYKRKKQARLAAKIAKRLEKMEHCQANERDLFKQGEGRTDDTMQIMLKRHQEDRMDLLKSVENLELNEAEQIHDEIMEEKSLVLTDQKRRLASMLASLQVEKSREVATLRGQLNALTKVELNLIDDLTSRGVLEEAKTKEMIDLHLKDVESKISTLNEGKERQKKLLTARLENKLRSLEEELVARHQQQAEDMTDRADKSPAYMYKKMLLLQKQKTERKQIRDNLRIEKEQAIEELERKFALVRLRELKVKELKFISELIQHADFDKDELADVFKAMFVTRSKEELDDVLQHAKVLTPEQKEARGPTTLLSRAKEELVRRQSSQRFQLTAKRQGLLKPKIRPRRPKDAAQFFPRSIRTVAQNAMVRRLSSQGSQPQTPTAM